MSVGIGTTDLPLLGIAAVIVGGFIMVSGYLAYETFLYGFAIAILSIPANITQALGGAILALPLFLILDRH